MGEITMLEQRYIELLRPLSIIAAPSGKANMPLQGGSSTYGEVSCYCLVSIHGYIGRC